jgi:hypothetical protein
VPERVALSLPILQDMVECVLFQQHANPDVLLVGAMALKEPKHKVAALQPAARGKRREAGSQLRGQA